MKSKQQQTVFLVIDSENAPGRVLAIFANEDDAIHFQDSTEESSSMEERTLNYGQPSNMGFNL
jgi:hypothetical protein